MQNLSYGRQDFNADRQTDGRGDGRKDGRTDGEEQADRGTDMKTLIVAFRNFEKAFNTEAKSFSVDEGYPDYQMMYRRKIIVFMYKI
jgi:hypothetical protein